MECAFLQFEEQVVTRHKFQNVGYALDVVLEVCTCCHCDIVHIFADLRSSWLPFVNDGPKDPIHHRLKCGWGVTETKEHHRQFP